MTETSWIVQFEDGAWVRWARAYSPEAARAVLTEVREARPHMKFRAVRETVTHEAEDW